MILEKILTRIETGIQDPSLTMEDDICPLVNEFVAEVSQLFTLPDLQEQKTIEIVVDENPTTLVMPETFAHDLYRVYNETSRKKVNIRSNIKALEGLYSGWESPGMIQDAALEHKTLWYRPIPVQDQSLTLFYYREPVPVEFDDDEALLDGIPPNFAKIAVDYALKELFALEEDGIDGKKVNTLYYTDRYNIGLAKLAKHCKTAPKHTPVIKRSARFF
ncbi:MAG: hypothetical protein HOG03_11550 [Desulfobacula sp.]|jgi:hypothetical protein|uniref:phage adaptor protein n=1 Tax=Desulfobacula sp. TaxID=2593537 RepID=UPI001D9082A4|nr:hypothetical protein [Desulfobacula sp.]MBT3805218.1 hypothetical protein [Desulfobacula sp.]MBT4024551.1 hypothetical protein [Desulfobacula sp.]MBT4199867.1 hypothetical protein [Desulfobacula sp.]MBT4507460.1 hypothetical protein [Desulfobacula sp.]